MRRLVAAIAALLALSTAWLVGPTHQTAHVPAPVSHLYSTPSAVADDGSVTTEYEERDEYISDDGETRTVAVWAHDRHDEQATAWYGDWWCVGTDYYQWVGQWEFVWRHEGVC